MTKKATLTQAEIRKNLKALRASGYKNPEVELRYESNGAVRMIVREGLAPVADMKSVPQTIPEDDRKLAEFRARHGYQ